MKYILHFTHVSLLIVLLAACSVQPIATPVVEKSPASTTSQWPTQAWSISSPAEQGIDPAGLTRAIERAGKLSVHSLLVIKNGFLVSETYFAGNSATTRHNLYSVTKSFNATLVGIALDQGLIQTIDQPVEKVFPNLPIQNKDANKSSLTLQHLLTMTSGLNWQEGDPVYREMYMSRNWVQYVLDIPMREPPGSKFNYCSGCSHVLAAVVQQATGNKMAEFANANLFQPLGIRDYTWEKDAQGIPIGGWGLQITPRDMAKLGYLYLHLGKWDGKQIVSQAWVAAATQPKVETGDGWGYGYQWWIDKAHGAYAARGRYGQLIYVVPDLDLIVVVTAAINTGDPMMAVIKEEIIPAAKK